MSSKKLHSHQRGFTIIELMIATTVLSVILLLVTSMMIGMGSLFYKGFNQARVQDGVRSIADEVSKQLELGGNKPIHFSVSIGGVPIEGYCIGSTRYSFIQNTQIGHKRGGAGLALHAILWRDTPQGGCDGKTAADLTDSTLAKDDAAAGNGIGTELITPNSRLTAFCIGQLDLVTNTCNYASGSPYTISVGIAYGDDDLLLNSNSINATCKGGAGGQFCATAQLSLTVANRI